APRVLKTEICPYLLLVPVSCRVRRVNFGDVALRFSLHAGKTKSGYNRHITRQKMKSLKFIFASFVYAALLLALWFGFRHSQLGASLGVEFPRAFASFALLLAPLWLFGFGAGEPLKKCPGSIKTAAAGLL